MRKRSRDHSTSRARCETNSEGAVKERNSTATASRHPRTAEEHAERRSYLDVAPVEVLATVLGYERKWSALSRFRLVSSRWNAAVATVLETDLSSQVNFGLWGMAVNHGLDASLTKRILCSLPLMSPTLLSTIACIRPAPTAGLTPHDTVVRFLSKGFALSGESNEPALHSSELVELGDSGLKTLYLSRFDQLTDLGVREVRQLTSLRELNLSGCLGLRNVGPALSQLTALQSLDLSDCRNLQGVSLVAVARLPALTSLNISGCTSLVDYSAKQLALLAELRSLNLSRCAGLTDRCFKELHHLKKLQSLFAADCQVGDKGLVPLVQNCPLEVLDLSFTGITDMLCMELGWKTMLLRSLTICGCPAITDAGLISIARGCGALKSLNARECARVGNPSLIELAKLKTLENLSVSDCCLISDEGVKALAKAPSLVSLELDGLALVSDDALLDLLQISSLRRLTASRCGRQRADALKEQQMRLNPNLQLQL